MIISSAVKPKISLRKKNNTDLLIYHANLHRTQPRVQSRIMDLHIFCSQWDPVCMSQLFLPYMVDDDWIGFLPSNSPLNEDQTSGLLYTEHVLKP